MRPSLRIVGHYSPFGEYPCPVVPICEDNRKRLFAVYRREFRALPATLDYVHHAVDLVAALSTFVAGRNTLFAFDSDRVVSINRKDQARFFADLLTSDNLSSANPYLVLSMAARARDKTSMTKALRCCLAELGPSDPFARQWYESERTRTEALREMLPARLDSWLASGVVLNLGCSVDKRNVLQRLARKFNWTEREANGRIMQVAVHPQTGLSLHNAFLDRSIQSVSPENEDWLQRVRGQVINVRSFAKGQLVLALSPDFRERSPEIELMNWGSALRFCLSVDSFRWLKPRTVMKSGRRIAHAMLRALGKEETVLLEARVASYCQSDIQTINTAIGDDHWRVDAFVVQDHAIKALLGRLPPRQAPVIIREAEPDLYTEQQLAFVAAGVGQDAGLERNLEQVFEAFCDFAVSENAREEITAGGMLYGSFAAVSDGELNAAAKQIAPFERGIAVCLVLDVSGSMDGEKLQAAKRGLSAFVGQLRQERGDTVGLVTASTEAQLEVPMTEDIRLVDDRIGELKAEGRTALVDAIDLAWLQALSRRDRVRAIVVLTDGRENASRKQAQDVLEVISGYGRRGAVIYGLAYGEDADLGFLQRFSEATGGESFEGTISNVRTIYDTVATAL